MNPDEQAIRNLIAQWHNATAAGDVEAVLRIMAEDVVFLVTDQPPMNRSMIESRLRYLLTLYRVESTSEIQEIEVSGNLAYCGTVLTVRITPVSGGKLVMRTGSTLSVLRKQANKSWVVVRDANFLVLAS
ncbi:MAG: SgcJ/EcaC family oxidoreductase [Gallionellaceae bacterium]|nr:MAG: SgcJ/EcaC family oxidoreductase [Gallionellaceae bacterium]